MKLEYIYISLLLACSISVAQVETSVYWHSTTGESKAMFMGLDMGDDAHHLLDINDEYLETIRYIGPEIIRIRALTPEKTSPDSAGWYQEKNGEWNREIISRMFDALQPVQPNEIMVSIPGWPAYMDRNRDGMLDRLDDFAEWCAELVRIINVDLNKNVRYWMPFEAVEKELNDDGTQIAELFGLCSTAMKAIDPMIMVGGGEFADYDNPILVNDFISHTVDVLDFFTCRCICSQTEYLTPSSLQNDVMTIQENANRTRAQMDSLGLQDTPLWLTECPAGNDNTTFSNTDMQPAVLQSLVLKQIAEQGTFDGYFISNKYTLPSDPDEEIETNPLTMLLYLKHKYLTGSPVRTASKRPGEISLFAVNAGYNKNVLLINRTNQYQSVNIHFEGWDQGNCSFLCYTLTSDEMEIDRSLFTDMLQNIELAPLQIKMFNFTSLGSVFHKPSDKEIPKNYYLSQPYPNPFNSSSIIQFSVKQEQNVIVSLYNASGQQINELFNDHANANLVYTLQIDGSELASGQYQIILLGEQFSTYRSIVYVK